MKKAAVRLKYVEAKVKLKKQLGEEDAVEKAREDKIREANREIFKDRLKQEKAEDSAESGEYIFASRIMADCIRTTAFDPASKSPSDSIIVRLVS